MFTHLVPHIYSVDVHTPRTSYLLGSWPTYSSYFHPEGALSTTDRPLDVPLAPTYPAVAAEKAAEELAKKALKLGYGSATVKLKGVGNSKQYVVQSLGAAGLQLTRLMDITPIPYNGCRRSKRRRV